MSLLDQFLSSPDFLPHGVCLAWQPSVVATMFGSQVLMGLSYLSVAATLYIFSRRRPDFPYPALMVLFAAVFAACGISHLTDAATLWWPGYGVQAIIKAVVAALSVPGAVLMWVLLPKALTLPSPAELHLANAELATTVEELRSAKEAAEVSSAAKSHFLAIMSHELRTPLNAVIGFAEALQHRFFGDLNRKQHDYVEAILSSGRHLLGLINDILDVSKVESGRLRLDDERVDLPRLAKSCVVLLKGHAEEAKVELAAQMADDLPTVRADGLRLKQVLINLLSNAVKFTPAGGSVTLWGRREADGWVVLGVSDTGIGMDPGDVPRAFSMFGQVGDSHHTRQGSGIGLPLAKALVELHGGRIEIETAAGRGTTVLVHIPPERVSFPG